MSDTFAIGAELSVPERVVYEMFDVEKPPVFPGGERALLKFLAENIKYPTAARENNPVTSVAITFIVETDGSISTKKVIRNDGLFAQSVLEVLDRMPCWLPGLKNGQPVAVQFVLPVRVHLE